VGKRKRKKKGKVVRIGGGSQGKEKGLRIRNKRQAAVSTHISREGKRKKKGKRGGGGGQ